LQFVRNKNAVLLVNFGFNYFGVHYFGVHYLHICRASAGSAPAHAKLIPYCGLYRQIAMAA